MKFRIFPTQQWIEKFELDSNLWRWYYNFCVELQGEKKISSPSKIRDTVRKYGYKYTTIGEDENNIYIYREIVERENKSHFYIPPWCKIKPHNRLIRGALRKFESSLKSALTNQKRDNITGFKMKYKSKKKGHYVSFEDGCFPAFYKKTRCYYGYRTNNRKRRRVSIQPQDVAYYIGWKGCTVYCDNNTGHYYLLFPVPVNYFPSEDRRCETQDLFQTGKVISLDPGMRKFLVGYSPQGEVLIVDRSRTITEMLLEIDKEQDKSEKKRLWSRVKKYIDDLHWKTIRYLVNNYDVIVLGDIKIASIMKNKNTSKMVKRVLSQYSFFKFKQRLLWVCSLREKTLLLTNEAYTSKTCCCCGHRTNVGASERYVCGGCSFTIDRDLNGALNILIKTITFLRPLKS